MPADSAINPTSAHIRILNPTAQRGQYVKTEYAYIRQYVKELHRTHDKDVDVFIHIGQAGGWNFVSIERIAFKQGMTTSWFNGENGNEYYTIKDDAGKTIKDAGPCPWDSLPMSLRSSFDVDNIQHGAETLLDNKQWFSPWKAPKMTQEVGKGAIEFGAGKSSPEPIPAMPARIKVKTHDEGGAYCCGFIHYESLAHCYMKGRSPEVLFCHVPGELDKDSLEMGRDAIVAIIVSAVNELLHRKPAKQTK